MRNHERRFNREEEEVDENDVNYSGNSYDDYYTMITNGEKVRMLEFLFYNAKIATNTGW
jgi:hypothetical protein